MWSLNVRSCLSAYLKIIFFQNLKSFHKFVLNTLNVFDVYSKYPFYSCKQKQSAVNKIQQPLNHSGAGTGLGL